jgi:hypothetical protein
MGEALRFEIIEKAAVKARRSNLGERVLAAVQILPGPFVD